MSVSTVASSTSTAYVTKSTASADQVTNPDSDLTKDDFLEMLITKLKYQDPLDSTSDSDFTSELAQYSSLEQETATNTSLTTMSTELSNMNTELSASLTNNNASQAVSMVGKTATVETTDSSGNVTATETGTVTAVKFEDGVPMLVIDGSEYSLSSVTQVS